MKTDYRSSIAIALSRQNILVMIIMSCSLLMWLSSIAQSKEKTLTKENEPSKNRSVKIGDQVSDLNFKDIRFLERSLDDFKGKKLFVIVCTNTTCPLVRKYLPKLIRMEKEYRDRDVQFLSLNVSPVDSIRDVAAFGLEMGIPFPCIKDIENNTVDALGVKRTPEVAVLDSKRRLRYRGRIDNQYRIGGTLPKASQDNLREAIDALLSNRKVEVKETRVDGCVITRSSPGKLKKEVTFNEHIKPLIQKHCTECHQKNTEAPFSLTTYDEVRTNAAMIAEVVKDQRMPPSYADSKYGNFVNHRGMNSLERDLIVNWVQAGTPIGKQIVNNNSANKQTGINSYKKWTIGKPDLVVKTLETHELPADGYIPYKYVMIPYVFKQDTWIEAVQILPSNPQVMHHCNMGAVPSSKNYNQSIFITGKVPGSGPLIMEKNVGLMIPKGSILALQIHYTTTGKKEKCNISVGFRFSRGKVRQELKHVVMTNKQFAISPGDPHYEVKASNKLNHNAIGICMFAHMHLRGKDITFLAHYPDGTSETLLIVPNYSFDWQMSYNWHDGKKKFPKGTRFECVTHYDNSAFNPFNPDPTATVKDGPQTYHEMMFGFVFYKDADEDLNLTIDPKTGHVIR